MLDVVSLARAWVSGGKAAEMDAALLRNLVEANMAQEGHFRSLSDEELLSNMFVCGFPTTVHLKTQLNEDVGFLACWTWYLTKLLTA